MQVVESKTARKLVKQKAEMVTIVDAKRANNISIALSGIRLPYAKIKARLLSTSLNHRVMRCRALSVQCRAIGCRMG